MIDFTKAVRISLSFSELTGLRGHPQTLAFTYRHTKRRDTYSTVLLAIHSTTHLDLPWSQRSLLSWDVADLKPQEFNAVILDFRSKQSVLEDYLLEDKSDVFSEKIPYLDFGPIGTGEGLWQIIQKLEIQHHEIEDAINKISKMGALSETFILIRTDWPYRFNRLGYGFDNPSLEGAAAFLCHPYLGVSTMKYLLDRGLFAIGHDLPSLENPLHFADAEDVHPYVRRARELAKLDYPELEHTRVFDDYFLNISDTEARGFRIDRLPRYYLKNLNLSNINYEKRGKGNRYTESIQFMHGNLLLVPVPLLRDSLGLACEVFFQPL